MDSLKKIRLALGLKADNKIRTKKFAVEATLLDGTTVNADSLEVGSILYIIGDDGSQMAAPEGTYETDDNIITVGSDGSIEAVEPQEESDETDGDAEDMKKTDAPADAPADAPVETPENTDADNVAVTMLKALSDKMDALIAALAPKTDAPAKEEMKAVPEKKAVSPAKKVTTEAFVKAEVKEFSNNEIRTKRIMDYAKSIQK